MSVAVGMCRRDTAAPGPTGCRKARPSRQSRSALGRDATSVVAGSRGLSGRSDRCARPRLRRHPHHLHVDSATCESRAMRPVPECGGSRRARPGIVLEQLLEIPSHVRRRCWRHRLRVDAEKQCGKVGEAGRFARTRPGQPVRTGFHKCEVSQVAELGCKPSGRNVPVAKQASDRAVAMDRQPMPLIGQCRRLPVDAVGPTRSAGRVAAPIHRRGSGRCRTFGG